MDTQIVKTEDLEKLLTDALEKKVREMGLDKPVDSKAIHADDKHDDSTMTKEEKVAKFLRAVVQGDHTIAKDLSEGVSADGGYLVPNEFRAIVAEKLYKEAVIRPRATVLPMTRDKMDIPKEATGITTYWTAENVALTQSDPTFGNLTLNTNKLTGLSKMSRELFADSAIGITDYVTGVFARTFALEEDKKFMTGAGTTEPKGIRTYTIPSVAQAGATLTADDLIAVFYLLPVQYRNRATWIMHNSSVQLVRGLKDLNGRYLWTDGLAEAGATLMGRPVVEQNDIPTNLGGSTDESEIFIGDLSFYVIGDRQTVEVESTTQGAGTFEKHQVALKMIQRIDGQLTHEESFALLSAVNT